MSFKENISATTIAAMVAFGPKSYQKYFLQLFRIQKALRALGVQLENDRNASASSIVHPKPFHHFDIRNNEARFKAISPLTPIKEQTVPIHTHRLTA
jgi:hypothetical protein